MNIKKLISVSLLCLGLSVAAQSQVISQAYEIALSDFTAPATENGGVSFKECADCNRKVVRVTAGTSYSVNGKTVRLEDFRKAVSLANDRDKKTVIVLHHLESDTVISVSVSI